MNARFPVDAVAVAARSLVEHDVPDGLRSRVLARIDTRRHRSRWPWLALSAAAALVLVWAVLPSGAPSLPEAPPTARVMARPSPVRSAADLAQLHVPFTPAAAPDTTAPVAVEQEPSAAEAAWHAAAVSALPLPSALDVAVSQPEPVTIALLEIEPLAAPSVIVTPLDGPRRPGER